MLRIKRGIERTHCHSSQEEGLRSLCIITLKSLPLVVENFRLDAYNFTRMCRRCQCFNTDWITASQAGLCTDAKSGWFQPTHRIISNVCNKTKREVHELFGLSTWMLEVHTDIHCTFGYMPVNRSCIR